MSNRWQFFRRGNRQQSVDAPVQAPRLVEPPEQIEGVLDNYRVPADASLVIACAPMSDPEGGGNLPTNCVDTAGTPIAAQNSLSFGVAPPVYATPGLFGVVSSGREGMTLQNRFCLHQQLRKRNTDGGVVYDCAGP